MVTWTRLIVHHLRRSLVMSVLRLLDHIEEPLVQVLAVEGVDCSTNVEHRRFALRKYSMRTNKWHPHMIAILLRMEAFVLTD